MMATASPIPPQASASTASTFSFPAYTSYPPLYTLQPNHTTRSRQLDLWSALIISYSAHHALYKLSLSSLPRDLFTHPSGDRELKPNDIRTVLDHMSKSENGGRIEWIPATGGGRSESCYIWWRTQGEWADAVYAWVEGTGQRNTVLTLYELREGGDGKQEWRGMDEGMLRRVIGVLVKRSKAQIFGQAGEGEGVKFF
jgi:ESCRT-II complex subunit VPS25